LEHRGIFLWEPGHIDPLEQSHSSWWENQSIAALEHSHIPVLESSGIVVSLPADIAAEGCSGIAALAPRGILALFRQHIALQAQFDTSLLTQLDIAAPVQSDKLLEEHWNISGWKLVFLELEGFLQNRFAALQIVSLELDHLNRFVSLELQVNRSVLRT